MLRKTTTAVSRRYKLNVRLVTERNKRPYLVTLKRDELNRAIEYFEHNLRL